MGAAYDLVVQKIEAATGPPKGGCWRCPAHADERPSLSIKNGDGKVLLNCHVGCAKEDVLKAVDLPFADLFDEPKKQNDDQRSRIVAAYDYTDDNGDLLFQVVRKEPKTFVQRRPDSSGGWIWNTQGVKTDVLFRLPMVKQAIADGSAVFVVEGEKDVLALEAAGEVATCNAKGAGKWRAEHAEQLAGAAEVVIVADKDAAGTKHAADVEASLIGKVGRIVIAEAKIGKDAADHLGAGLSADDFEVVGVNEPTLDIDASLQPVDLGAVLDGRARQPVPEMLIRDDGKALLYAGYVNGIHGQSGDGKGWVVCHLIFENARRGKRTMYLDLEDTADSITGRLLALGMTSDQILTWLVYVRPQVPLDDAAVAHLVKLVAEHTVAAVVIDSLGEAFSLEGLNEDKDVEVGPWYRRVARVLAETGAAVWVVDHSTKAADNPLFPSGSKRKRASITGASYLAEAVQPFVKGIGGRLRLTCAKDRHGTYRRGEAVADLVMSSDASGAVGMRLYAPSVATSTDITVPTILAARAAVKAAKEADKPLSQRELVGLMKIKMGTDGKRGGIDYAASTGALAESQGPRNSRVFTYSRDLEEDGDE